MYYQSFPLRPGNAAVKLTAYVLDEEITHKKHRKRPGIIVCPGGGYLNLAHKESEPVVARFLGMGFNVFLLDYSVYFLQRPDAQQAAVINEDFEIFQTYRDLECALQVIADHAREWYLDSERLYLLGFSAGAHLIAYFMEHQADYTIPAPLKIQGLILAYPMLTVPSVHLHRDAAYLAQAIPPEFHQQLDLIQDVDANFPKTFLWQGGQDTTVSPKETTQFVLKLQELGVPCEYHLFQSGIHGLALADETSAVYPRDVDPTLAQWINAAKLWLAQDQGPVTLYQDERQ
ncbi:alpha/beta hydrolase [Ligilactobacillus equi]|uniref:alpha/beta hydrolase n=1 Tax=Ligilactobacillus equi TaxID=137357 RepID=UPI002ED5511C